MDPDLEETEDPEEDAGGPDGMDPDLEETEDLEEDPDGPADPDFEEAEDPQENGGGPVGMLLFALPLGVAGVWVAARAVRAYREGAREEAISVGIFALAFCALSVGLMIVALYGTRTAALAHALDASRSGQSWSVPEDVSLERIDSDHTQGLRGAWALALLWNGFLSPVYVGFLVELWRGSWPSPFSLIVPIVGIVLILRAVRWGRGWGRSGASTFEMDGIPAVLGGRLVGRIVNDRPPADAAAIKLRLACLRREKSRRYGERLMWDKEKTLPANAIRSMGMIPVEFDIPAHCEPTSDPGSAPPYIVWVLQATADAPGVDFAPRFEVPVLPAPPDEDEPI